MNIRTILIYLIFVCFTSQLSGQEFPSAQILARARVSNDSVVLRWALNTELAWRLAHDAGYIVERADLRTKNSRFERIAGPLKPWSADAIAKIYLAGKDRYTGMALATLYGNTAIDEKEFNMSKAADMSRMLRMRFAYNLLGADQNAAVAEMSALRFVDRNVVPGASYAYRIYSPIPSRQCKTDTAMVYVDMSIPDNLPLIPQIKINQGDRKLELLWSYLRPDFSAFNLERSTDAGRNWTRLNTVPYVVIESMESKDFVVEGRFIDTGLINYRNYRYRISAITTFGESVPFSGFVESYPRDLTPPPSPEITKITQGESKELRLEWTAAVGKKELKGYKIGRADQADGPYIELGPMLSPNTTSFKDENPDASFGNYYIVYAMDTAGNVSASLPKLGFVKDDLPPPTPELISATMDTTGKVSLFWKSSKAPDLMGYRLFTANDSTHEFGLVTGDIVSDTFYFDSLSVWTLSKYRYYRLAALDLAYNMSKLSRVIPVRRPDLIPPVAPAILETYGEKGKFIIKVQSSAGLDVEKQYIEITGGAKPLILPFAAQPGALITLEDSISKPGIAYELRAFAVDSSGNRSNPSVLVYAQRPISHADKLQNFEVLWDEATKSAKLTWTATGKNTKIAVYRSKTGSAMEWIGETTSTKNNYIDKPTPGQSYKYCIHLFGDQVSVYSAVKELNVP